MAVINCFPCSPFLSPEDSEQASLVSSQDWVAAKRRPAWPVRRWGRLWWQEAHPGHGGTTVMVAADDGCGRPWCWLDDKTVVGTRAHTYGGLSFAVGGTADAPLCVVVRKDQALCLCDGQPLQAPKPWWQEPGCSPAGIHVLPATGQNALFSGVVGMLDDHHAGRDFLAFWDTQGHLVQRLSVGDFCSAPSVSPDGQWVAVAAWDDPHAPWVRSRLVILSLSPDKAFPLQVVSVLDNKRMGAIVQPRILGGHSVVFSADRHGDWDLYQWDYPWDTGIDGVKKLASLGGDCVLPSWQLGEQTYAGLSGGRLVVAVQAHGSSALWLRYPCGRTHRLDIEGGGLGAIGSITHLSSDGDSGDVVSLLASGHALLPSIVSVKIPNDDSGDCQRLGPCYPEPWPAGHRWHCAVGDAVLRRRSVVIPLGSWRDDAKDPPNAVTHAHLTFPESFAASSGSSGSSGGAMSQSAVITLHGGPTAQSWPVFSPQALSWMQHGMTWVDVNYRGSTSFGRNYRLAIKHRWGQVDAADLNAVVDYMEAQGLMQRGHCIFYGSSAGGLTSLMAVVARVHRGVESCSLPMGLVLRYPVVDLTALRHASHRFERGYTQWLVGDDDSQAWQERSPIHWISALKRVRLLVMHGSCDPVVPLCQVQQFCQQLQDCGGDVHLEVFDDEGHGFRSNQTLQRQMELEKQFMERWFANNQGEQMNREKP